MALLKRTGAISRRLTLTAIVVATFQEGASAQSRVDRPIGVVRSIDGVPISGGIAKRLPVESSQSRVSRARLRPYAPIASAILPGSGQFLIGEDRFVAYAAIELAMWLKRRNDRLDQSRQERDFRALARDVARSHFSPNPPDGDWEYYEEMKKFSESGEYSLVDGQLVPDTSSKTFNGFIWRRIREHNPDMPSALAEYERRAIKPEFQWSWRDNSLQYDIFQRKTDQRNAAAGRVASDLVVIGANHVLSMVDAFRSVRLRAYVPAGGGVGLGGTVGRRQ
jgi:hypothetical protein